LLCCLNAVSYGQQTSDVPIDVPIILDAGDQAADSLNGSDLRAKVNHHPIAIASITSLARQHLQYVLINDENRRTLWPDGTQQQIDVASQFLNQVVAAGVDVGSLVNFSDEYYLDARDEKDPRKIAAKLTRGGMVSAMYDAVVATAHYLARQPAIPDYRKVVFLFCDGEDNASQTSFNQASEVLQRTAIPIFIIAPSSVKSESQGKSLNRLARQSGGRVYFLPKDTRQVNFDFLKHDLAQSFLLKISISSSQGMRPLDITDAAKPRVSIIAPSQIAVPQFHTDNQSSNVAQSSNATSNKKAPYTQEQLADLRAKCAPYSNSKVEDLESRRAPLPPHECAGVLAWMRDPRVERLYISDKPPR